MDNLTHSLIGGLIGIKYSKNKESIRDLIVIASVIAGNFPDTDIFYSSFLSEPFGYLLHHRGHTHTLLGALLCGILTWLLVIGISYFKKQKLSKKEISQIGFISLLGGFVHILLDYFNTYGVHPFWPVSNKWYYGDTIFIIEPIFWVTLSLAIYSDIKNKVFKYLTGLAAILGLCLINFSGRVPEIISISLSIIFILLLKFQNKPRNWIYVSVIVLSTFFISGKVAKNKLNSDPKIVSSFVTASPANPFCWKYLQMKVEKTKVSYFKGIIDVFPFIDLNCEKYSKIENSNKPYLVTANILDNQNCRWQAFLRFARIPSIQKCENKTCMNDERFKSSGRNFSTFEFEGNCPENLPPWEKNIK